MNTVVLISTHTHMYMHLSARQVELTHIKRITNIYNTPIGTKRRRHLRHSTQHRRTTDRRQETAKAHHGNDNMFAVRRKLVVDGVVVTRRRVRHMRHVMVADGRDCALQLQCILLLRSLGPDNRSVFLLFRFFMVMCSDVVRRQRVRASGC